MERLFNPNDNTKNVHIINDMDIFIEKLKNQPKAEAKPKAIAALKRTGVLTFKGTPKDHIVSSYD